METASILLTASLVGVRGFGEAKRRRREPSRGAAAAEGVECGRCPLPTGGAVWGKIRFLVSKYRLLVHCGGYFYGSVDYFISDVTPALSLSIDPRLPPRGVEL